MRSGHGVAGRPWEGNLVLVGVKMVLLFSLSLTFAAAERFWVFWGEFRA
jgi:hypothetical protein